MLQRISMGSLPNPSKEEVSLANFKATLKQLGDYSAKLQIG